MKKFTIKPYIGTRDYFGKDLNILMYIFEKWRKLALSYNYEEYINPLVEYAALYRAKSGEDLGNKELYDFTDKGGREIAIRPEATPSVTRLVATFYNTTPKPIRMFSIQNFMRYERPQRGRYREFWQFNIDMFGDDSVNSDLEMLKIAAESVLIFNPPKDSFVIYINSRPLMDLLLTTIIGISNDETKQKTQKIIDKYTKLSPEEFEQELELIGLSNQQIKNLQQILTVNLKDLANIDQRIAEATAYKRLEQVFKMLKALGLEAYFKFNPAIVRGIDYYDGIVFEAFDLNPENNRAMFGGGRYNGLGYLFGIKDMPAIGFAPGNATMELFLKNWDILPQDLDPKIRIFLPQIEENKAVEYFKLRTTLQEVLPQMIKSAQKCNKTIAIEISIKPISLNKALKYALTKDFDYIIIAGETEFNSNKVLLKNLKTKQQTEIKLDPTQ